MIVARLLPALALSGVIATAAYAQTAPAPSLSDAQIVTYVQTVNMGETMDGKMALARTKNADVKMFADHMVKDHTTGVKTMAALAKKLGLKPADSETTKALMAEAKAGDKDLKAAKEPAFDKSYVAAQARMHAEVAATIQDKLIPAAKNDDLKSSLTSTLATVQEHQKMAQDLSSKIP